MQQEEIKKVIDNYIKAYNLFDIDGMLLHMHKDIIFQNVLNEEINMSTNGISELRAAAEQAKALFKSRCQTVTDYKFSENGAKIEIDYFGEFAADIPNVQKRETQLI